MRLIYTLSLLITISSLSAQPNLGTWQWANSMGGSWNDAFLQNEVVNDMCTDKYGNVYVTGILYNDPSFDMVPYSFPYVTAGNTYTTSDGFVAKYDKCGHLLWARSAEGPGPGGSIATSIYIDDSLNIYILGRSDCDSLSLTDSTHTFKTYNPGLFWAKYDSSGNVKWLRSSGFDFGTPLGPINLILAPDGNLCSIIVNGIGPFSGLNYTSTHEGCSIFEFDLNGTPIKIFPIDSESNSNIPNQVTLNQYNSMKFDSRGNLIIAFYLQDTSTLFDTFLIDPMNNVRSFLMKVDYKTQKIKWIKEWTEDIYQQGIFGPILIDNNDNIFADGQGAVGDVFDGDTIRFNTTAAYAMEVLFKLDSNGNSIWHIVADYGSNNANNSVNAGPIAFYGDQYLCSIINISGPTYWGDDTFNALAAPYFITLINTNNGKAVYGDSIINSNTLNSSIYTMLSDLQGNIYLGGLFNQELTSGSSNIYTMGGQNDAFVMKWGVPCAEDSISLIPPLATVDLVAYASSLHSIDVNWQNVSQYALRYRVYRSIIDSSTGYSLIDSVSNSITQYTDTNVVANQIYWYRVSAVNGAGETFSNSDSSVIIPNGIADLNADIKSIALYPNPAANYTKLSVWSNVSASVVISVADVEGREYYSKEAMISQGKNDFIIDISGISAGVYIVNMTSGNATYSKKLVVIK